MKISSSVLPCLLFVLPISATAQTHAAVTARMVWTDPKISVAGGSSSSARLDFDRSIGGGVAGSVALSDAISAEIGISRAKPDLSASDFALGSLRMTPVTAAVQYHFSPHSISDVYAGAGAAYAVFDSVRNGRDLALFDYSAIDFENQLGWLVNGGVNVRLHPRWALNLDAKYMRFNVSTSARLTDGTRTSTRSVHLSPVVLASGITFRF